MLENLPKMLLGISQKFSLLSMLGLFPIMLDYANSNYSCELPMYMHIISSINCVYSFELVALTVYITVLWL